jgi:hypothetical protein
MPCRIPCPLLEKHGLLCKQAVVVVVVVASDNNTKSIIFPCIIISYNSKRSSCMLFWQQVLFSDNKKSFKLLTLVFLQNLCLQSLAKHKIHNSRMEKLSVSHKPAQKFLFLKYNHYRGQQNVIVFYNDM